MKRNLKFLFLLAIILFVLAGCDDFFTFNLYEGLDPVFAPKVEKLTELSTEDALAELDEAFESDSVIEEIVSDPEGSEALDDFLVGIYDGSDPGVTDEQQVQAAILSADLNLAQSQGEEFVDNVFLILGDLEAILNPGPTPPEQVLQEILGSIVPPEIEDDPVALKILFTDLLQANAAYEAAGGAINPETNLDEDTVTGGVVLNALICGLVGTAGDVLAGSGATAESQAEALTSLITLQEGQIPDVGDFPGLADTSTLDNALDFESSQYTALNNLAAEAGMDLSELVGGAPQPEAQ